MKTKAEIAHLIEISPPDIATRLKVYFSAAERTLKDYHEDNSAARNRDHIAAEKTLDEYAEAVAAQYGRRESPPTPQPAGQTWPNRIEALKHLQGCGYKIGKSKLYNDAKAGLLRLEPDGSITEAALDAYVRVVGLVKPAEIAAGKAVGEREETLAEKARRELEKLDEQILKLRHEREVAEGKYIPRADFEMELAARAAVLEAGLRHFLRVKIPEWIRAAGGDAERCGEIVEAAGAGLDRLMTEFAGMDRFQVLVMEPEAEDG